jgi:hypothetical protein
MEKSYATKTIKPKKHPTSLLKMTSVKSTPSKTSRKSTSSVTTVLPLKLKKKLNKNLKKSTPNKSFLSTITPKSRPKKKCWLWVKKNDKRSAQSTTR